MSVKITMGKIKFRDPITGKFFTFDALAGGAEQSLKAVQEFVTNLVNETKTTLNNLVSSAKSEITSAKDSSISAINSKSQETITEIDRVKSSIPSDYSSLSANVEDIKKGTKETAIWHLGFYLDENGDLCQKED